MFFNYLQHIFVACAGFGEQTNKMSLQVPGREGRVIDFFSKQPFLDEITDKQGCN